MSLKINPKIKMSENMTNKRSASIESTENQNKVFTVSIVTGTAIQPVLDYAGMMAERVKVLILVGDSSIAAELQCFNVKRLFSTSLFLLRNHMKKLDLFNKWLWSSFSPSH